MTDAQLRMWQRGIKFRKNPVSVPVRARRENIVLMNKQSCSRAKILRYWVKKQTELSLAKPAAKGTNYLKQKSGRLLSVFTHSYDRQFCFLSSTSSILLLSAAGIHARKGQKFLRASRRMAGKTRTCPPPRHFSYFQTPPKKFFPFSSRQFRPPACLTWSPMS